MTSIELLKVDAAGAVCARSGGDPVVAESERNTAAAITDGFRLPGDETATDLWIDRTLERPPCHAAGSRADLDRKYGAGIVPATPVRRR